MTYRLHPEATLEHERQVAYYEERSTGLGRSYHVAKMLAIDKADASLPGVGDSRQCSSGS